VASRCLEAYPARQAGNLFGSVDHLLHSKSIAKRSRSLTEVALQAGLDEAVHHAIQGVKAASVASGARSTVSANGFSQKNMLAAFKCRQCMPTCASFGMQTVAASTCLTAQSSVASSVKQGMPNSAAIASVRPRCRRRS
jgi:hypothetical protein